MPLLAGKQSLEGQRWVVMGQAPLWDPGLEVRGCTFAPDAYDPTPPRPWPSLRSGEACSCGLQLNRIATEVNSEVWESRLMIGPGQPLGVFFQATQLGAFCQIPRSSP